jgi:DNA-binding transcriptional MerR regulator/methylmalonyl-CoA mutase cobalamin-binding subunit
MKSPADFQLPRHPIKVVVRRTGLSADALRAWERRYEAVTPLRSETGRRLYSDADIERLLLLKRVAGAGRSIGQVATLSREELVALAQEDESATVPGPTVGVRSPVGSGQEAGNGLLSSCLDAIQHFDGPRLHGLLSAASLEFSQHKLIEELLVPLVWTVGDRWCDGTLRIGHEHLATTTVQAFLGELTREGGPAGGPAVVVATPTGQRHQLGAMMAAAAAVTEGWRVVYLGADLPAEDIAAAATQRGARVVALSIVYPSDDPLLPGELTRLRRLLSDEVVLIAGGRAADGYRKVLDELGAIRVADLKEFRSALQGVTTEVRRS